MSPLKIKKLRKIRSELDKLDNLLIKLIKKRTFLVKKVLLLKEKKSQIVDKKRIKEILLNIKKKSLKNNIDPKIFSKISKPSIIDKNSDFVIIFSGKKDSDKSFILFKNSILKGYGYFQLYNNINSEKKINSRLVKVDSSKRVKNYVYRLISEKRYKKLVNLKEIYKFSNIE